MEAENLKNLNALLELLAKGGFIEGMKKFFDENVTIQELDQPKKHGRDYCLAEEEKMLAGVAEFIQYTAHSIGAGGDKTFYEATMEFKTTDGQHVIQNQVVVTTWKNNKIINERYYHGNA